MEKRFKIIQALLFTTTLAALAVIWSMNGYENTWLYIAAAIVAIPASWYINTKK